MLTYWQATNYSEFEALKRQAYNLGNVDIGKYLEMLAEIRRVPTGLVYYETTNFNDFYNVQKSYKWERLEGDIQSPKSESWNVLEKQVTCFLVEDVSKKQLTLHLTRYTPNPEKLIMEANFWEYLGK